MYNFLPSSITTEHDILVLYNQAKRINSQELRNFYLHFKKSGFEINYEDENWIWVTKGDLSFKLGVTLYSF